MGKRDHHNTQYKSKCSHVITTTYLKSQRNILRYHTLSIKATEVGEEQKYHYENGRDMALPTVARRDHNTTGQSHGSSQRKQKCYQSTQNLLSLKWTKLINSRLQIKMYRISTIIKLEQIFLMEQCNKETKSAIQKNPPGASLDY